MDVEKQNTSIIHTIENFLNALGIEGTVTIEMVHEKKALVSITVSDGQQGYIIGKQGATLLALQHLVSLLARKERSELHYQVDINNYQSDRDQIFLKRVRDYVQEKEESKELLLWPMTGYERRLVHEYFLKEGTHSTESEDFGSKRVIRVIKK